MKCPTCGIECYNYVRRNIHQTLHHQIIWNDKDERPDNDWDGSVDDEDIYKEYN